jgi:uncharacterized protein YkwD
VTSRKLPLFLLAIAVALVLAGTAMPQRADASAHLNAQEKRLVRLVNRVRLSRGLAPLAFSRGLTRAADSHSIDLARRRLLDHASPDGTPFDRRVRSFMPALDLGETLAVVARGRGAATTVVRMWLASPPHKAILLSGSFSRIGVGIRTAWNGSQPSLFVTADFASTR